MRYECVLTMATLEEAALVNTIDTCEGKANCAITNLMTQGE